MDVTHVLLIILSLNLICLLNASPENDTGPCLNNGTCQTSYFGSQSCVCKPGFVGNRCEYGILSCSSDLCQNGGNCTTDSTGAIKCECSAEYWGMFCEYGIKTCPCHNNATCHIENERQVCDCKPGFTSSDCFDRIVDCSANPCQNGASCTPSSNFYSGIYNFTCICSQGYWGQLCENEILQDCTSNPCANNATCENSNQYLTSAPFVCHCPVGFYGEICEYEKQNCSANSCANGGTCIQPGYKGYTCQCMDGFYGTRCEYESVNCSSNPCENEATCTDVNGKFKCNCNPKFYGDLCQNEYTNCIQRPCQNGGACFTDGSVYFCTCPVESYGAFCEFQYGDCSSNPCENAGLCVVDEHGRFLCLCTKQFKGRRCQVQFGLENWTECKHGDCRNGGFCSSISDCSCRGGFRGIQCDTPDAVALEYVPLKDVSSMASGNVSQVITSCQGMHPGNGSSDNTARIIISVYVIIGIISFLLI